MTKSMKCARWIARRGGPSAVTLHDAKKAGYSFYCFYKAKRSFNPAEGLARAEEKRVAREEDPVKDLFRKLSDLCGPPQTIFFHAPTNTEIVIRRRRHG